MKRGNGLSTRSIQVNTLFGFEDIFLEIAQAITDSNVQLVATAPSKNTLPGSLTNFNGRQFFTDFLKIPTMTKVIKIYSSNIEMWERFINGSRFGSVKCKELSHWMRFDVQLLQNVKCGV
jgi:hypothetical protein